VFASKSWSSRKLFIVHVEYIIWKIQRDTYEYDLCVKFTKNKTCIKKITLKLSKKSLKYLSGLTPGLSPFLSFKLSSAQGLSYF